MDASRQACGVGCRLWQRPESRYLLRNGWNVSAADRDPAAVEQVRLMASAVAPHLPSTNFRIQPLEHLSFEEDSADVVIASAVLHFASGHEHFDAMLAGLWRMLAPGGLLFARLASSIGIADRIIPLGDGRYRLPDGSDRYLLDEKRLTDAAESRPRRRPARSAEADRRSRISGR